MMSTSRPLQLPLGTSTEFQNNSTYRPHIDESYSSPSATYHYNPNTQHASYKMSPPTNPSPSSMMMNGTIHELNQKQNQQSNSNSNFSTLQNYSPKTFPQELKSPGSSPYSVGVRNSNSTNGVGIGGVHPSSSSFKSPMSLPQEINSSFLGGTKTNNNNNNQQQKHDTNFSKWANSPMFNTGTTPGDISAPVINTLKSKWGPSRDELKDKLANTLATDTNISILPGYKSNPCSERNGRRSFQQSTSSVPCLNYGDHREEKENSNERVPSAVTRAQNAIGRTRLEIGQAQSMMEMNKIKTKGKGIYRNTAGGDGWSTIGSPDGFGIDSTSVRRYKQESYRKDLEQQIQQKRLKVAEERRQEIEGSEHPFGAKYNSPIPSHYAMDVLPKNSYLTTNNKISILDDFKKLDNKYSPRFQPKTITDDVIGRSITNNGQPLSQRRHFPQKINTSNNPVNPDPVLVSRQSMSPSGQHQNSRPPMSPRGQQQHPQSIPIKHHPPPEQQHPNPQYPVQYYPYGSLPGYPYPSQPPYQGYPQYPLLPMQPMVPPPIRPLPDQQLQSNYQQQPISGNSNPPRYHNLRQQHDIVGRSENSTRIRVPQMTDESKILTNTTKNSENHNHENFTNKKYEEEEDVEYSDDCTIPMRMRIWQTSDQLPDPELKMSTYKIQLKKQIIQNQKDRAIKMAKEIEEDEKQDKRIEEYQALMKTEIDMEREVLAKRVENKQRQKDLALQRAAENHRLAEKLKSKKLANTKNNKKQIQNNNNDNSLKGSGDYIHENKSSTSVSTNDGDAHLICSDENVKIESLPGYGIVLPAISNHLGGANNNNGSIISSSRRVDLELSHLSQIQKILALESQRYKLTRK